MLKDDLQLVLNALTEAAEASGYSSHDDSVGYRICCQVASYMPHKPTCALPQAINIVKRWMKNK